MAAELSLCATLHTKDHEQSCSIEGQVVNSRQQTARHVLVQFQQPSVVPPPSNASSSQPSHKLRAPICKDALKVHDRGSLRYMKFVSGKVTPVLVKSHEQSAMKGVQHGAEGFFGAHINVLQQWYSLGDCRRCFTTGA